MTLKPATHKLVLWIATAAFVWSTVAVGAPILSVPVIGASTMTEEIQSAPKSGCGHHEVTPPEEDSEDCGDDPSVSCVSCKVMETYTHALAAKPAADKFDGFSTTSSSRVIKPALDPPRI